jgi:hypothetical protein
MAPADTNSKIGKLMINVFDGARKPILQEANILIRIIDGNREKQFEDYRNGPSIPCESLPFFR